MARGQTRVLGSNAVIRFDLGGTVGAHKLMEIDKFTAKAVDEVKESSPLGETVTARQVLHKGWDLTFEAGLVDQEVISLFYAFYRHSYNEVDNFTTRGTSPTVEIVQTIKYADGKVKVHKYEHVTLSEMNIDISSQTDEIKISFNGKAMNRKADQTTSNTGPGALNKSFQDVIKDSLGAGVVYRGPDGSLTGNPIGNANTRS